MAEPGPAGVRALRIEMTAYYAVQEPAHPHSEAPCLLLALHGWGQKAPRFLRDFAPLAGGNVVVCAPQAPHQFYLDIAAKKVGFNWLTVYDRPRAIDDVNRYLARLIETLEAERGQAFSKIFVLGFSQGVSMAWRFAVSGLAWIDGLVHVCADLALDVAEKINAPEYTGVFPVLLARGVDDQFFAGSVVLEAQAILEAHGFKVDYLPYAGGHEINAALIEAIHTWLDRQCKTT